MIEVKHLEKYYGSDGTVTKALDDISFISYDGEFLCIMGASGSGKSTRMNVLGCLDKPDISSDPDLQCSAEYRNAAAHPRKILKGGREDEHGYD